MTIKIDPNAPFCRQCGTCGEISSTGTIPAHHPLCLVVCELRERLTHLEWRWKEREDYEREQRDR